VGGEKGGGPGQMFEREKRKKAENSGRREKSKWGV